MQLYVGKLRGQGVKMDYFGKLLTVILAGGVEKLGPAIQQM